MALHKSGKKLYTCLVQLTDDQKVTDPVSEDENEVEPDDDDEEEEEEEEENGEDDYESSSDTVEIIEIGESKVLYMQLDQQRDQPRDQATSCLYSFTY